MLLLLAACAASDPPPPRAAAPSGAPAPRLVLCGGGEEGDQDDTSAWSTAYGRGLANGDVTGDDQVRVAVLATGDETGWIPAYLVALGADEAFNLTIATRDDADDPETAATLDTVDAVFLKGGDQGEYYDQWNETGVETALRALVARGGGVIGTSAGAMSQSGYALAGGADYVSADVLTDSRTEYLDDVSDGGSGIHADFLDFLPGTLVDTHFVVRGRLGRLAGALARLSEEGAEAVGIGIDEQTCLVVRDGVAEVSGVGSVTLLRAPAEAPVRVAGEPLVWADLELDRLVEGWSATVDGWVATPGADAEAVAWTTGPTPLAEGAWSVAGRTVADEERFATVVQRAPAAWATRAGSEPPLLADGIGVLDAHDADRRGANDEALFRALHDQVGAVGYLVGDGGAMALDGSALLLAGQGTTPMSTMILDTSGVSFRGLSPSVSVSDAGDGALHAAALLGVRLHVLHTDGDGRAWDPVQREVVTP